MKWKNETQIVYNEKDLKAAISAKYADIRIKGDLAGDMYKKMNRDPKLKSLSSIALLGGLFVWPLFIAGLIGHAVTIDFSCYTMVSITDSEVVLELRKKYRK